MNRNHKRKRRKNTHFWRAFRFLAPHRRIVVISIVSAFFVGMVFTSGMSATLPIIKVLINGETIQGWVDRQILEKRLDASLAEKEENPHILRVAEKGPAGKAALPLGSRLISDPSQITARTFEFKTESGRIVSVRPAPVPWYLRWAHTAAFMLPAQPMKAIGVIFCLIALCAIVGNVIRFFQEYLSDRASISAVMDIRRHLYNHVLHMPMSFFGLSGTSDVTSRLVQDSAVLQDGFKI